MPNPATLHDAFLYELRDAYDAELQVVKALPRMIKAATSPKLTAAFEAHLKETRGHVARLERVFAGLDEKASGEHCDGMAGIIEESASVIDGDFDEATTDACLIAAAQRIEHYEMAAYGTLVAWARTMDRTAVANLLEDSLNEEKSADSRLSSLARNGINQKASAGVPALAPTRQAPSATRLAVTR